MPKQPRLGFLLVASVIFSLISPVAMAQSDGAADVRARELYKNGEQLYEEGLYEEAISAWVLAYELSGRPLLLYNIANALERIGRYEEALERLNQYRALAPSEEREVLERRMRSIERRLEEKRADERAERDADRFRQPEGRLGGRSSGPAAHPAGALLIGIGAAGVTTGGIFGGLALDARDEVTALCQTTGDLLLCPDTASTALDRDQRYSLAADLGIISGAVSIGVGIIINVLHQRRGARVGTRSPLILPSATPDSAHLLVTGQF